ncbi:MAG: FtsX-like permease family protein [Clostridiales bacterium]|nr:FtsX-like permease family protein [Clostridiales bacterium]
MSQVLEYVKIALMNIKGNKGRSILTMLGIIIGVSSVIMIISIGNGVKSEVNGQLDDMAGGQLYMYSDSSKTDTPIEFTQEDFDAIMEQVDHVIGVTPSYNFSGTSNGRKGSFATQISAGTPSLEFITKTDIIKGKYFSENDYYSGKNVCIITESSARTLFGTTDVVGMSIDLEIYGVSREFTICGIRADSTSSMLMMGNTDSVTMEIPLSTLDSYGFYIDGFNGVYVIGESAEYSSEIAVACINLMEARHDVRGTDAIMLENFNDYLTQVNQILGYITIFVVFVAAISLLVGGIGVMNIMLVSVTERTREIGIRKALGARTNSIMLQFLAESGIITLVGGIIGITIGIMGAELICFFIKVTPQIQLVVILGASIFSSAVGLFFGIYPANKAAKLSPIEALRHE